MGVLAGYFAFKGDASQGLRLFLTTGVLGAIRRFRVEAELAEVQPSVCESQPATNQ
jgi:hypothetical protein